MLTMEKVVATQKLLDIVIYMFNNKVQATDIKILDTRMDSKYDYYSIRNQIQKAWCIIYREGEDDWFLISIHPERHEDGYEKYNAYRNCTTGGNRTCSYSSITNRTSGIAATSEHDVIDTLSNTTLDEGVLFQLQTMYDDYISYCLVLELYLRDKIGDDFYVPINIDKFLEMEVQRIEEITEFWGNYIEAHEELV